MTKGKVKVDVYGDPLLPVKYNNEIIPDYYMNILGEIFDMSKSPIRKIKYSYPDKKKNPSWYTRCSLRRNGKRSPILVHIVVMDTLKGHTLPRPKGVTKREWMACPTAIKEAVRMSYQVNHINEDKHDWDPDNLEYVTARQNQQKHQELKRYRAR